MKSNASRSTAATQFNESPPSSGRDACEGAHYDDTAPSVKTPATFQLANSLVRVEEGRAGYLATVKRPDGTEWAGPFDREMIDRLAEVAEG